MVLVVKIKFSNVYEKMEGVDLFSCKLIRVDRFRVEDMDRDFILKDCKIKGGGYFKDGNLGFKVGLMLLIKDKDGKGFVTLRSFNERKFRYYKGRIGEKVDVVFTGGTSDTS